MKILLRLLNWNPVNLQIRASIGLPSNSWSRSGTDSHAWRHHDSRSGCWTEDETYSIIVTWIRSHCWDTVWPWSDSWTRFNWW